MTTPGAYWQRWAWAVQLVVLGLSLVALAERYLLPGSHPLAAGVAFWVLMGANQVLAYVRRRHRPGLSPVGPATEGT